ncbi:hypothetical protein J7F01_08790 [Streptomyces sp. ISL-22]|uniref:hypothetical protein n=1 Tax=unclassified Streptomyces TaxID=2593676 RepID=UPI001BEB51DA|nr:MULTISPECIES: hypothetical protein [unclassified Streptomyces]MBT2418027.1 hypothetical protein [Streptomyces sp. ISL-24]MBT2432298.1 hypothetical protein [Streptomyces sp. ISL-22]
MMYDLMLAAGESAHHGGTFLAAVYDPGQGKEPPGVENLKDILQWVAWIVLALCVAGILVVAGRMAVSHQRGQGGEHATALAYVLGACVLVGAASGIVTQLV